MIKERKWDRKWDRFIFSGTTEERCQPNTLGRFKLARFALQKTVHQRYSAQLSLISLNYADPLYNAIFS
jgi:hypothetical protein